MSTWTKGAISWTALSLALLAFVLAPGPERSFFSGMPLSSKATALFVMLIGVAVAMLNIRPQRAPRLAWAIAIGVAVVAKVVLASLLVTPGWHGQYFTGQLLHADKVEPLQRVYFPALGGVSGHRIDRELQYDESSFGLDFINDLQRQPTFAPLRRSSEQPMRMLWRGWTDVSQPTTVNVGMSAAGLVILRLDRIEVWRGVNPLKATIPLAMTPGVREIEILYDKPRHLSPTIRIDGLPNVTTTPADAAALRTSKTAELAIVALGVLVLLAFAAATFLAYLPLPATLARVDLARLAVIAYAATFLMYALVNTIPRRHGTTQLAVGDDFLNYEGMSRGILRGDILLLEGREPGTGEPYYHYPLYPFALAATHALFGDDFANVILFNLICIAMTGPLFAAFLRKHLSSPAVALVLLGLFVFAFVYLRAYTRTAYSDNLYLITMFAALLASIRALEWPRMSRFFVTGALIALAAATRPSGFIFMAFYVLVILWWKELGTFAQRLKALVAIFAGFGAAVSPFTVRNRIVSGRWVMLVGGYMSITQFLFPPGMKNTIPLQVDGKMPTIVQTMKQVMTVISTYPEMVLWVEIRKVLFTLGWGFGPTGSDIPFFGLYPLLFLAALFMKRIPRETAFVLVAFLLSHLASMVLAAPWTYGFKSIVPFHLACIIGAAFLLKPRTVESHV
ncbi:MAG TPA: glycosyltransferase family 39 protein [Thermoanaerobaculia bacterium]